MVKGTRQAGRRAGWGPSEAGECAQGQPLDTMRRRRWRTCRDWGGAQNGREHIIWQKSGGPSEAGVSFGGLNPQRWSLVQNWRSSLQCSSLVENWSVQSATLGFGGKLKPFSVQRRSLIPQTFAFLWLGTEEKCKGFLSEGFSKDLVHQLGASFCATITSTDMSIGGHSPVLSSIYGWTS